MERPVYSGAYSVLAYQGLGPPAYQSLVLLAYQSVRLHYSIPETITSRSEPK